MPASEIYVCVNMEHSVPILLHVKNEADPSIEGMIEVHYAYQSIAGSIFNQRQEREGYKNITLDAFLSSQESSLISWIQTMFDRKKAA